jgi:hypothetical protein
MKTTLVIAFSLVVFSSFAQYGSPPPPPPSYEMNTSDPWGERFVHFGLNFAPGLYWTSPNSSNTSGNGASFGYGYGLNLEFYFTRNYAFLTGFEVSNIGAKYINAYSNPTPTTNDSTITHNESLQYLQLPFELKLKTVPFGNIRYFGLIGIEFGFLLKATDNYNTTAIPNVAYVWTPPEHLYSDNNEDIYSETDFFRASFVIGGGVQYTLAGSTALQASLTYNSCFTNVNNTSSTAANIKGVELMLGILF